MTDGLDSFHTLSTVTLAGHDYLIHRLDRLAADRLPFTFKVVLENLLRHEDGHQVTTDQIDALLTGSQQSSSEQRSTCTPPGSFCTTRTGSPPWSIWRRCATRLNSRRRPGPGQPTHPRRTRDRPLGDRRLLRSADARDLNVELEYDRNSERYRFLKWGQASFDRFKVVPPGHGHHAPGQHRVPGPSRGDRRRLGLPGPLPGHRLPHDDGQRPRRPRLGHRRHRGRGVDARPATVDRAARRPRLPPDR